jgi:hypothetical protein
MVNVSDNIQEFDLGETTRLKADYTTTDESYYDPDTVEVKVYDPSGTLKVTATYAAGDVSKDDTGKYSYDYVIASDADVGWWLYRYTAVAGTNTDVQKSQFKVRDPERRLYTQPAYVYSRAGQDENFISTKDVNYYILESMGEVDSLMGKCFDYSTSVTEWFDTSQPNQNTKVTKVFLGKKPIRTVTSVEEYDTNADLVETYTSADYYVDLDTGLIGLHTEEFEHQEHRVKVVYNYGFDVVPAQIQQLTTVFAAMKILLNHIGNSVDDVTSFSACGISMGVGEPYTASHTALIALVKEKDRLVAAFGRVRQSIFVV